MSDTDTGYKQQVCSTCGKSITVPSSGHAVIRCSPLGYGHKVTVIHSGGPSDV